MTYFISCTTQITIFNYYIEDINPIYQFDTLVTSKIDPTAEEESIMDTVLTVVLDSACQIVSVHKPGGTILAYNSAVQVSMFRFFTFNKLQFTHMIFSRGRVMGFPCLRY